MSEPHRFVTKVITTVYNDDDLDTCLKCLPGPSVNKWGYENILFIDGDVRMSLHPGDLIVLQLTDKPVVNIKQQIYYWEIVEQHD